MRNLVQSGKTKEKYMWISTSLKCPDEGTWYKLISITDEGKVTTLKYLLPEAVDKILEEM